MKKFAILVTLVALAGWMTSCGGTDCDKAADIIAACADDTAAADDDTADTVEVACEGDALTLSLCAVNNESAVCGYLEDPTDADNAYGKCLIDALTPAGDDDAAE